MKTLFTNQKLKLMLILLAFLPLSVLGQNHSRQVFRMAYPQTGTMSSFMNPYFVNGGNIYRPPMNTHYNQRNGYYGQQHHCACCNRGQYQVGMRAEIFNSLMNTLNETTFDNNKLQVAKLAIKTNGVSVNQLKSIMDKMTFDNNKLELAKYAFQYTWDQGNYFTVADNLTFYNSKRSLMKYLEGQL